MHCSVACYANGGTCEVGGNPVVADASNMDSALRFLSSHGYDYYEEMIEVKMKSIPRWLRGTWLKRILPSTSLARARVLEAEAEEAIHQKNYGSARVLYMESLWIYRHRGETLKQAEIHCAFA